jgi:dihydrofolate reductase
MKFDVAAAISMDAKLTKHGETDIHAWVSDEDQQHFQNLLKSYPVRVMGTTVYEAIREQGIKMEGQGLRVVLTHHPETYAAEAVPGQLEFYTMTPAELVTHLDSQGFKTGLIVGGGQMITDFLKANVIDRFFITLEPFFFGKGNDLITEEIDVKLQLLEQKMVNERGTQILTYQVV